MLAKALLVIVGLASYGSAFADTMFSLSFNINGNEGQASLTASDLGGGQFRATSGTLNMTTGAAAGNYSLVPIAGLVQGNCDPGSFSYNPPGFGGWCANNILYPSNNPILDIYGLIFASGDTSLNLFGNSANRYSFFALQANGVDDSAYFVQADNLPPRSISLTQVPEPASLALVGLALAGLVASRRKPA